jgi:hypothetical protein
VPGTNTAPWAGSYPMFHSASRQANTHKWLKNHLGLLHLIESRVCGSLISFALSSPMLAENSE